VPFVAWLAFTAAVPGSARGYDYPIEDPYLATVLGTRAADRAVVPGGVPFERRELPRVAGPRVPAVFWQQDAIEYGLSAQAHRAPLIFVIAGTGARYDEAKMSGLGQAFYGAGFHVVSISSPTHPDFLVTAMGSHVPGYMPVDVSDLYALMQRIRADLEGRIDVAAVDLIGYSLGATEAAFLAERDARERRLGFEKVLLIDPAVSVYASVRRLDALLASSPGGPETDLDALLTHLFASVSSYVQSRGRPPLDSEMLYHFAGERPPTGAELRGAIALVFLVGFLLALLL